ncbi:MAG TPA: alkaline phosphatase family protein [Thermoleophilaceae bacterium]|nr:alkaline phosphatase family protein [Thermoleophilaceae bacterium]
MPKKLVLAVIDALKPELLDRAIAEGRAPALGAVVERGTYVRECVSAYPSVTPVASSDIATGVGPDRHHIPSMNWYHRGEGRYIEYGSSFQATRAFGIRRSLYDTVYNMNMAHLSRATPTVYEQLEDAGYRTACTTFLIYRGRKRHRLAEEGVYPAIARAAQFTHAVYGPTELFYADLFQSRKTGCTSMLGRPGQRDQHTGCVGAYLVENDLFDFMLFSLPDNDTHSHKYGPYAQVQSIAAADRALERIMHVAGGPDAFLDEYAVIVMSDHSQTSVEDRVNLMRALPNWRVLTPADPAPETAEVAVSPAARSAMVYVLDPERREQARPRIARDLQGVDGLDLVVRLEGDEAVVWSERGELRFAPDGELEDARGRRWSLEGNENALDLRVEDGRVSSRIYPDPLGRLWSSLTCPNSGDVLISAMPGYEFVDWGGTDHVGGGSHGSLHRGDSLGVLIYAGTGPTLDLQRQWSIEDVTPMVLDHFQVSSQ